MQRVTSLLPTWERKKSNTPINGKLQKAQNQPIEMKDEEARPSSKSSSSTNGENTLFGIPEPDDPDPFGVLALQNAGLEIREAGSHTRVDSTQFEFRPSPKSPIFTHIKRGSVDTMYSSRASYMSNSKRASMLSTVQSVSHGTQTEDDLATPLSTPSLKDEMRDGDENVKVVEYKEVDYTKVDLGPYNMLGLQHNLPVVSPPKQTEHIEKANSIAKKNEVAKKSNDEFEDVDLSKTNGTTKKKEPSKEESEEVFDSDSDGLSDDEVVICEAATAAAPRPQGFLSPGRVNVVKAKGNVVNIKARPPPPVPPRSSARISRTMSHDSHGSSFVRSPLGSPMRDGFETASLKSVNGEDMKLSRESSKEAIKEEVDENNDKIKQIDGSVEIKPKYVDEGNQTTKSVKRPSLNPNKNASSFVAASMPRFDKMAEENVATKTAPAQNDIDKNEESASKTAEKQNKKSDDRDYVSAKTIDSDSEEKSKADSRTPTMPGGFGSPTPQ